MLSICLLLAVSSTMAGAEYDKGSHKEMPKNVTIGGPALGGMCPVCVYKGKATMGNHHFVTKYKGDVYFFKGIDQQKAFVNDPEKYLADIQTKYDALTSKGSAKKEEMKGSESHQKKGSY